MPISLDQVRSMLSQHEFKPNQENVVSSSDILGSDGEIFKYVINHGRDPLASHQCDQFWGDFNYKLLEFVKEQQYSEDELQSVLNGLLIEDGHWDWLAKSCTYHSDEYNWFYLIVEDKVEAVCLIYHPKESAFDSGDIFYIEYVAVAPWNRPNPIRRQKFKGLGSILVKSVVGFAVNELGLRPGFSLHSLPGAEGFYINLGMQYFPDFQKGAMKYFEMPEDKASAMVEV